MRRIRAGALLLALAAGVVACRESTPLPTQVLERTPVPVAYPLRLTYNVHDDRTPAWSADGDTIYYSVQFGLALDAPTTRFAAIPADAGLVESRYESFRGQDGEPLLIYAPRFSPDYSRLAFAHVVVYHPRSIAPYGGVSIVCEGAPSAMRQVRNAPRLGRLALRVRPRLSREPITAHDVVELALPGRALLPDLAGGTHGYFRVSYLPFQHLWDDPRAIPFVVSWSPDGRHLATSNGVQIFTWELSDTLAVPVPGTRDGVAPAWSPDGRRLAFTRLARGDSTAALCTHMVDVSLRATEERIMYEVGRQDLVVLDLQSGATVELGEGADATWSRDGRFVYARRGDAIWRIPADGTAAVRVPGTEGGRDPAVSPDGRLIAFSRLSERGNYDIWITTIQE